MRDVRQIKPSRSRMIKWTVLIIMIAIIAPNVRATDEDIGNVWPTFPRRNIASMARNGYLRDTFNSWKRSVSALAKNGQLPTFSSPYDDERQDEDEEGSHEKRNIASIARLRSYASIKRNIQALAREGYRLGRGPYNQLSDKRNVQALARNGYLHKRGIEEPQENLYSMYPSVTTDFDPESPLDFNDIFEMQQSVNPEMFPPLSHYYKRGPDLSNEMFNGDTGNMDYDNWYLKRGIIGMPVHGLLRPTFSVSSSRNKRYILKIPESIDRNDDDDDGVETQNKDDNDKRSVDEEERRNNYEKRHIGSLARLGLLPSFRFTGGRYSRSGRARLLLPSQELYRKHSFDENFGVRNYFADAQGNTEADADYSDVPPKAVSTHSHPTGRIINQPITNDLPSAASQHLPTPPLQNNNHEAFMKNHWLSKPKEGPQFYYFRSFKLPFHESNKRYPLLPAVGNVLFRKNYPNKSLPSRTKNQ